MLPELVRWWGGSETSREPRDCGTVPGRLSSTDPPKQWHGKIKTNFSLGHFKKINWIRGR